MMTVVIMRLPAFWCHFCQCPWELGGEGGGAGVICRVRSLVTFAIGYRKPCFGTITILHID